MTRRTTPRRWKAWAAMGALVGGLGLSTVPVASAGAQAPVAAAAATPLVAYNIGSGVYDITGAAAESNMFGYANFATVDGIQQSLRSRAYVIQSLDSSLSTPLGRIGPKRSPVRDVADAVALARAVVDRPGFTLVGLMSYEGHVAGQVDQPRGRAW